MNKICFVNGSPRGNNSASQCLIDKVVEMLDKQKAQVHEICVAESLGQDTAEKDFALMRTMDSIIFVTPLYVDAVPSSMLEYMHAFDEYLARHQQKPVNRSPRIYAIINNGFLEGAQNINALKIMAHYAARIGFNWRFGIGIGAGEYVRENIGAVTMENRLFSNICSALAKLAAELESREIIQHGDIMTNPSMPGFLFMAVGNCFWTARSKKPGVNLKKKVWPEF
jgi:multimeric flavodoxin WrbA